MLVARQANDRKALLLVRTAVAAALVLSVTPRFASAEVLDPLRGYALDGTPVGQQKHRDGENVKAGADSKDAPRPRPAYVSYRTIRRIAADSGFKITDQPHRNGRSFIANADDDKGHHFRLIFNAFNGQLVERTDLGPDASQVKTAEKSAPAPSSPVTSSTHVEPAQSSKVATVNGPPEPYSAPTWDEVSGKSPVATTATAAIVPPPPAPAVSTPPAPPVSYAAVTPCEMAPAAAPKQAEAQPAEPAKAETTTASTAPGPYSAPTWDEVSAKDASIAATTPEADAAPGSPRITGSIPAGAPNKNSPPEPYWAPTWDEISGQDAAPQTGEKP